MIKKRTFPLKQRQLQEVKRIEISSAGHAVNHISLISRLAEMLFDCLIRQDIVIPGNKDRVAA